MRLSECLSSGQAGLSKLGCLVALCCAIAIAAPGQTLTTLYGFCSRQNCADGSFPAGLTQGGDGNFYGVTSSGGSSGNCQGGCGSVFQLTPGGTLTVLHSFHGDDGSYPSDVLVRGIDGSFYGTTSEGGTGGGPCGGGCGTVFRITPGGTLTVLHNFTGPDGGFPGGGLALGNDGNFYGVANVATSPGLSSGLVFKISPLGAFTTLYLFCSQPGCSDGSSPEGGLVQGTDGNFYGTTHSGGAAGMGTVFQLTPGGTLSTLYSFCSQPNCADGAFPVASLIQGHDGSFYGTTLGGGSIHTICPQGCGTLFKITPIGTLSTLYVFCSQSNCDDGYDPEAPLLQAADGNFYGTTGYGGAGGGSGTVFQMTPAGTLTVVHAFTFTDGFVPTGIMLAADGNLYGTTVEGGGTGCNGTGCGTAYRLTGPNPTPLQFLPLTPCRVVDTRNPNGEFGGPPIQGGTYRIFVLPDQAECAVPSTAAAYSLNVTVVPHVPLGYLTIWPAGRTMPVVSTMNSLDARTKANAAIVPAGANAAVSVFASNTTDLVLDIDGYFAPPGADTYQFYKLTPCRVIDTRGHDGPLGGPFLSGQVPRDFPVEDSPCLAGANNVRAYSFNVTVVPHPDRNPLGYLTVWPQGSPQPNVSTLNNPTATDVANAAIVPVGTGGGISVFPSNDTDLVVDIDGYFSGAGAEGLSLYPTTPCRVIDTRDNHGQPFVGEKTVNVVGSICAPPSGAQAYVFNATVVPSGALGYLTLWPNGQDQPLASTLNALDGLITSNMAIVPTTNGSIDAFASNLTQLVLDISSYFAP